MFLSGNVYPKGPCARILLQDSVNYEEEMTTGFHMGTAGAHGAQEGGSTQSGILEASVSGRPGAVSHTHLGEI